jgi:ElaB/YqjD/DUF883 family membrane-anchored ribosome-binding protein
MALWGSRQSDLQSRIDDIQTGLAALAGLLGDGAGAAGKSAARGARAAQDTASHAAHDAADTLGPLLNDITGQIDNVLSLAGREGKQAYKAVESKVSDNAMVAVVAAAGIGILIGSIFLSGGAKRAVSALTPQNGSTPQRRTKAASRSRPKSRRKAA